MAYFIFSIKGVQSILDILILLGCLIVLAKSAQVIIKNLVKIAHMFSWSTFSVGFFIMGIATSAPEFSVGLNSVAENTPQLSLGNTIGASIVLLTLITGLSALVSGKVIINASFAKKDLMLMSTVILLPVVLLWDSYFSRFDSFVMLSGYLLYVIHTYRERHRIPPTPPNSQTNDFNKRKFSKHLASVIISFLVLAIASRITVDKAVDLAETFKVPIILIGVLLFSVGTNFPEIVLTITSIRDRQKSLLLGNVLGSATTNTLVIALVSFIQPFGIKDYPTFTVSVFFLATTVFVFSYFVRSKNEISRLEGFALLSIYSFFVIAEVFTKLV